MSFIPVLKTPIGQPRKTLRDDPRGINTFRHEPSTERLTGRSESRAMPSQVRFKSSLLSTRNPVSLNQNERERRKHEALEFLKKETRSNQSNTKEPSGRYTTRRNNNPDSLKTYQLLGEKPIDRISNSSSKRAIYDDHTIKNITRESLRRNPLGYGSRIADNSSRISKPTALYTSKNNSLLSSLSNFGSKVFRSILYSEQDTNPIESSSQPSFSSLGSLRSDLQKEQDELLKSEIKQKELDLQLAERRRYLDELNKQIVRTEKHLESDSPVTLLDQSKSIDKQIEKLDGRLQSILEEVNSSSNGKLLKELESIKDELTTLRRKQETNNMKFESKFEDMKLENQLNRQKFDQLFDDLEEKRKELDMEKDTLIRILKRNSADQTSNGLVKRSTRSFENLEDEINAMKRANRYAKRAKVASHNSRDYGQFDEDDDEDGEDGDDANDEDDDDEGSSDIINYIMKNKRKKAAYTTGRMKSHIRQITNNLKKIEEAAKKSE